MSELANPQQAHYEWMHSAYAEHYYDRHSMTYRRQMILKPLLSDADLDGKVVADVASGDGYNSLLLREIFPTAITHGFDISDSACATYETMVGQPAFQTDILKPLADEHRHSYDAVLIVGGLHHCITDLDVALANVRAMLKPGGSLYVVEPNARFFLNVVRMLWYRRSVYFEDQTEAPLTAEEIAQRSGMRVTWTRYFGGPAYFLILNSLLFGLSPRTKSLLCPPLMAMDKVYDALPGRAPFPAFMARLSL